MKSPYAMVFAVLYDAVFTRVERKGLRAMRKDLLRQCTGDVLEIGAGTGLNVGHNDAGLARLVLTEPEPHMAAKLRATVRRAGIAAQVIEAPAESLPFPDASFDTVVSTLVLCTVPAPDAAIREVRRVLKPGGRFLFIEHVRSDSRRLARWQDRLRGPWSVFAYGCQCNRNTLETIRHGFTTEQVSRDRLIGLTPLLRPLVRGQARAA
jgi:ubiquinone/menaquinone biosynthesis C-methylase UbiE